MTFVVRTIGQRSGGGEIVRERRHDGETLLVGRGTDCHIQVADLAVMLNHVRIRRLGDHVSAEAIGGVPFDYRGKSRDRAEFGAGDSAVIGVGGHRLTIAPDAAGTSVVTLERVGPISTAADAADERKIFSLAGTHLAKRGPAWALALAVLTLFLAWPIAAGFRSIAAQHSLRADAAWNSGPLSTAHASLANDCNACHAKPFVSVRDSACKSCHAGVHDHAAPARLRAALFDASIGGKVRHTLAGSFNLIEDGCTSCHKEHNGPHGAAMTKPTLCIDCHRALSANLTDTDLLDSGDFDRAHPEFRPLLVAAPSFDKPQLRRIALDDRPLENNGLKFPHALHLSAANGVARMAAELTAARGYGTKLVCADCHHADAGGVRFRPIEMERDCGACHSLAFARVDGVTRTLRHGSAEQTVAELRDFFRLHGGAAASPTRQRPGAPFTPARPVGASPDARIRAVFEPGGACFDCHAVIPPATAGSLDFTIAPVSLTQRYLPRGWFSHADHDAATMPCARCHAAKSSTKSADVLIPRIAVCRECHTGAHPDRDRIVSQCADCHGYHPGSALPSQIRAGRRAGARTEAG